MQSFYVLTTVILILPFTRFELMRRGQRHLFILAFKSFSHYDYFLLQERTLKMQVINFMFSVLVIV
jgi:hypothetical protein